MVNEAGIDSLLELAVDNASLKLDLAAGHIRALHFHYHGRELRPLHTAPWVTEEPVNLPANLAVVERHLSGDFLCAPFAANDVEGGPPHGWSANSHWEMIKLDQDSTKATVQLRLEQKIMGAQIDKKLVLSAHTPILFQTHTFTGGTGRLPVAHHVMTNMVAGGTICHAPIDHAWTAEDPLDKGCNVLAYPGRSQDLTSFPRVDGGTVDLSAYPLADVYEDFVTVVGAKGAKLGWTAVLRHDEDDIVFVVKDARQLPVTMLWHSNGGRQHEPWNSRHRGVLGIEDGVSYGAGGHAASCAANHLSTAQIPTSLELSPTTQVELQLLIGVVPRPAGWTHVTALELLDECLSVTNQQGDSFTLPLPSGCLWTS